MITGASGQLGQSLRIIGNDYPAVKLFPTDINNLDITDDISVSRVINDLLPDFLINCAAYTDVDKAETDSATAYEINSTGAEVLARQCAENEIPLIHISTDYVFPGNAERPYLEHDPTGPLTVYGKSKLEGKIK